MYEYLRRGEVFCCPPPSPPCALEITNILEEDETPEIIGLLVRIGNSCGTRAPIILGARHI